MNAEERATWKEIVESAQLYLAHGRRDSLRMTYERIGAILAADDGLAALAAAEQRAADAEALALAATERAELLADMLDRSEGTVRRCQAVAQSQAELAARMKARAEAAEAALEAVIAAARALVRRLANINLRQSNAKALGAALQYGPEVSALQDAIENAPMNAAQELSALRAVAEAAYKVWAQFEGVRDGRTVNK